MKTGIIFDLDGTLLDTLDDLLDATNYALTTLGYPTRTKQELRSFVGNGAKNQMRLSLPEGSSPEDVQKDLAEHSVKLMMKEWNENRHIHENYNADTGEGCDVPNSDKFYHWGALLGMIGMLESGEVSDYLKQQG